MNESNQERTLEERINNAASALYDFTSSYACYPGEEELMDSAVAFLANLARKYAQENEK